MKFTDDFLDDLRASLPVSAVVGRYHQLIKKGSEYVAKDDQSISCNDQKKIWYDFGKTDAGGDIFAFVMLKDGCSFVDAVKRCAEQAGVSLPSGGDQGRGPANSVGPRDSHQRDDARPDNARSDGDARGSAGAAGRAGPRKIVATYDYTDEHGRLIYQVVRWEPKNFSQRRPYLDDPGTWVWALDDGEFMRKGKGKDWVRFNEDKFTEYKHTQRKKIEGGVQHSLYRLPELVEAVDEEETVFLPEGEKDVETFEKWDLVATTNSGGAKHWTDAHAAHFTGADVVIPIDNDDAGRARAHKIAASLKGKAKRIRVLDLSQFWSGMKDKADITDWKAAGGTREQLLEIIDKIGDWQPEPPRSTFGAVRFIDVDLPGREHSWLIKGLLPQCDMSILAGEPGSGKSFKAIDIGFSVARAALDPQHQYMGRKVVGGLVLYQAGEGGIGVKKRIRAYRQYHGIPSSLDVPFVLMPHELNLFVSDEATKRFIDEARAWSAFYELPVALATIDTVSAATTGANENMAEDMTKVLNRGKMIADELRCHVQLVHHWNKAGSLRGWSGLKGNVETVIEVEMLDKFETEEATGVTRQIRSAKISKQKDGEGHQHWNWTLPSVKIGTDSEGDSVTSCIVRPLGEVDQPVTTTVRGKNIGVMLSDKRIGIFKALLDAIDIYGETPPAILNLPTGVQKVVKLGSHYLAYTQKVVPDPDDAKKNQKTLKSRLKDFREFGQNAGIIGVHKIGGAESADAYIWPTGKPVFGHGLQWPTRAAVKEADPEAPDPEADFWIDE